MTTEGENKGLMGGNIANRDGRLYLLNCLAKNLPCTLLSKGGHCSVIIEGVNTDGKTPYCGKLTNPKVIPEES